jgi:hypothetical protein
MNIEEDSSRKQCLGQVHAVAEVHFYPLVSFHSAHDLEVNQNLLFVMSSLNTSIPCFLRLYGSLAIYLSLYP